MTTAITVPNGAASPVNKTFSVARSAAGDESAVLYVREGANTTEFPKLEFSTRAANTGRSQGRKGTTTLLLPYGQVVNGVFVKTDHISVTIVSTTPNDAPDAIRKDAAAFLTGVLANAQLKDLIILGFAT